MNFTGLVPSMSTIFPSLFINAAFVATVVAVAGESPLRSYSNTQSTIVGLDVKNVEPTDSDPL